jgi:DNA helicase II / ATP-dependent DNA helicase PcrA
LAILIDVFIEEIKNKGSEKLAEAIDKMRKGDINIQPGYDGEYGKVSIL